MKIFPFIYFLLSIILVLYSCASSGEISGGERDTTPPILVSEKSSPQRLINYNGEPLVFIFSEYIELKDPKSIDISPPLTYVPDYTVRGKKLKVEFSDKEELKDDVTYSIHFNDAVQDYTEGNPAENLVYIFSTGSTIDNGSIMGKLELAADALQTEKDVLIMLHANVSDSIVAKDRPLYYTKVDENNNFKLEYLKEGIYSIYALEDKNFNLLYDLPSEMIGFSDEPIDISQDTTIVKDITLFLPFQPLQLVSSDEDRYGIIKFRFNKKLDSIPKIVSLDERFQVHPVMDENTVNLYYNDTLRHPLIKVLDDTIKLKLPEIDSSLYTGSLELTSAKRIIAYNEPVTLTLSYPLADVDTSKITLIDTTENEHISFNISTDQNNLFIKPDKVKKHLQLTLDSMAIQDIYGKDNDSLGFDIKIYSQQDLHKLTLNLMNIDSFDYIIYVYEKDQLIYKSTFVSNKPIEINDLMEGTYKVEVIEDKDQDGLLSKGNYWLKKQPEKELRFDVEVREDDPHFIINWLEANIEKRKPEIKTKGLGIQKK